MRLPHLATFVLIAATCVPVHARWKPEYASNTPEVRAWYKNAELTPQAQKRFNFKSCCEQADVVKTQFRVNKTTSGDEWFWDKDGEWRRIPDDVIHWGQTAPGGQAVLFVIGNQEACFWPPDGGI